MGIIYKTPQIGYSPTSDNNDLSVYFSIIRGLFIYLTPFIPLSFSFERGNTKRGALPL